MSDNGQQVPLIERLRRVPAAARVLEHTPNPLGYDTASIPVGALCREAADRIAELEAALAAERERLDATKREVDAALDCYKAALNAMRKDWREMFESTQAAGVELAAERERRKAAEAILRDAANCIEGHWLTLDIDAHFSRYKD